MRKKPISLKLAASLSGSKGWGVTCIKEAEHRIQQLTRQDKGAKVNPMALFYFQPGQLVISVPSVIFKAGCKGHGPICYPESGQTLWPMGDN